MTASTRKRLRPGKLSPRRSIPDQILKSPYVGSKKPPGIASGPEVHDEKGIEYITASGRLAAQIPMTLMVLQEILLVCVYSTFSLHDQGINWLDRLFAGSISTLDDLITRFLAQFFPPERIAKLQNDILIFQRHQNESLYDAWNRFKDLLRKVPHHGLEIMSTTPHRWPLIIQLVGDLEN
ncbi:zinc finger, CCHC-type containing protein [Tanacetum coccineum]|uniref:Zinc finger, CCHC-type containing protein n=1 Tax=Tanacetum coccineum TaxID=301880 RepID=A0ABQ5A9B7_9ASTR